MESKVQLDPLTLDERQANTHSTTSRHLKPPHTLWVNLNLVTINYEWYTNKWCEVTTWKCYLIEQVYLGKNGKPFYSLTEPQNYHVG